MRAMDIHVLDVAPGDVILGGARPVLRAASEPIRDVTVIPEGVRCVDLTGTVFIIEGDRVWIGR
jgi:hypothetical protein